MGNEFGTKMTYEELKNSCPDKDEIESMFQASLSNNNKDQMWFCVWKACNNIAKSIYKKRNVIVTDEKLLEVTTDACSYCMSFILGYKEKHPKGIHPDKLSSYCYLRVLRTIQAPKKVWEDQNIVQMPRDNYKENVDMEIAENA